MKPLFSVMLLALWLLGLLVFPGGKMPPAHALDAIAQTAVQHYFHTILAAVDPDTSATLQGVWLQSTRGVLGHHQGTQQQPAASLTKMATTLVALHTWGPRYQFVTVVGATGPIRQGVLQGDLVVQGSGDPFFVWEDAIMLGNTLQRLGIRKVTGNLIIHGDFFMNFTFDRQRSGKLLQQGMHADRWSKVVQAQYHSLPMETPKPRLSIRGAVQVTDTLVTRYTPLVRHRSLPLVQILKRMNVYSNNTMAAMLTHTLGGGERLTRQAALVANITQQEIHLVNGSGLGSANQMSPRAACALLIATHKLLRTARLTLADVFPIAGYDRGTIRRRQLPEYAIVKTGTLRHVSTLAGVMMTRTHGPVWFAILNQGDNLNDFRAQQDELLQALTQSWGAVETLPSEFAPTPFEVEWSRNEVLVSGKPL